jgi:hypothetical protein
LDLLGRDILILDAAVDEASEGVGGLLDLGRVLGHGELLEELLKHLGGLSVLGRHVVDYCLDSTVGERITVRNRDDGGVDSVFIAAFLFPAL